MATENVIDFKNFGLDVEDDPSVGKEEIKLIGRRVVDYFKKFGFCYLKNHGVDKKTI